MEKKPDIICKKQHEARRDKTQSSARPILAMAASSQPRKASQ